jgi:hypothetical protein
MAIESACISEKVQITMRTRISLRGMVVNGVESESNGLRQG